MTIVTSPKGFCPPCFMTKQLFKKYGIKYKMSSITPDQLKKAGYRGYPVVMPNDKLNDKANWNKFNIAKIKAYAKKVNNQKANSKKANANN